MSGPKLTSIILLNILKIIDHNDVYIASDLEYLIHHYYYIYTYIITC